MEDLDWGWFLGGVAIGGAALALAYALCGCGGAEFTYDPPPTSFENPGFQMPQPQQVQPDAGPAPTSGPTHPAPVASSHAAPVVGGASDRDADPPEAEAGDAGQDNWQIPLPIAPDASPAEDALSPQAQCAAAACQTTADCQGVCPQPQPGYQYCCEVAFGVAGHCYMSSAAACP